TANLLAPAADAQASRSCSLQEKVPMAFKLDPSETIDSELRRIVVEQLDQTDADLREDKLDLVEKVHETRKRFKEIRALLRLYRGVLDEAFDLENRWYRDIGRELSSFRDAAAAAEAAEKLADDVLQLSKGTARKLKHLVRRRSDRLYANSKEVRSRLERVKSALPLAKARILEQPLAAGDFTALEPGWRRMYHDGQQAMQCAYKSNDPADFHEWRKRTKDFWYQTR